MLNVEFLGIMSDAIYLDEKGGTDFADICDILALLDFSLFAHKFIEVRHSKDCMCVF